MKKSLLSLFLTILLAINMIPINTLAQNNSLSTPNISITLINEENPLQSRIITIPTKINKYVLPTTQNDNTVCLTTDVVISIPKNSSENPQINISTHNIPYTENNISPMNSQTNTDSDSSGSYRASITCTYNSGSTGYLLTKVNGKWTKLDKSVSISNRKVTYACTSGTQQKQRNVKYPSSNTYSYTTGYTKRVKDVGSTLLGGVATCNLKRGTGSKWSFTVNCNVIKNSISW